MKHCRSDIHRSHPPWFNNGSASRHWRKKLRVLYVAMTRAKEHLIIGGTCAEALPDKWQQQWSGFAGKIPAETVLAARSPLDWLGPVAADRAGSDFRIAMHSVEEVAVWSANQTLGGKLPPAESAIVQLKPLAPAPFNVGRSPGSHRPAQLEISASIRRRSGGNRIGDQPGEKSRRHRIGHGPSIAIAGSRC